jgi:hypothetical protein
MRRWMIAIYLIKMANEYRRWMIGEDLPLCNLKNCPFLSISRFIQTGVLLNL